MKKVIFGSWLQRFFSMVSWFCCFYDCVWWGRMEREKGRGREGRGREGRRREQGCNFTPPLVGPLPFSTFDPSKLTKYCIQGMSSHLVWCSICQSSLEHPHRHAQHCPLPASWASLNPAKLIVLLYLNHHLAVSRPSHLMKELLLGIVIIWAPDSRIISTHICVLCFRPLPSILNSAIQPLPLCPW